MPKLVAMMIVRNEADRYLKMCLNDLVQYVDEIVIVDDGSTDRTPDICMSYDRVHVVSNERPIFWENESALRTQCWNETISLTPDWIIAIDADEVVEDRMKREVSDLMNRDEYSQIAFQLVEFWGSLTRYRVDKLWNPENRWAVHMIRYDPGYPYLWRQQPLHCGRLPANLPGRVMRSSLRWKHYGYSDPADHEKKYEKYISHDPLGQYSPLSHYVSILDKNPVLREWKETPESKGEGNHV